MSEGITAELTSVDSVKRTLTVTIPAAEVSAEFEKTFRDIQKRAVQPGFRRGHVPMRLIRQVHGAEVKVEVARELISRAYSAGLEQTGARPVNEPEIRDLEGKDFDTATVAEGQPIAFTAGFEVRPEVKLPEYKGLKLVLSVDEVTDDDVSRVLEDLRHKTAAVRDVAEARSLRRGDIAIIEFEGFADGEPIPGGKGTAFPLELGSGTFIPGFEEQVEGLMVGEEKKFILTMPADYHQEGLAGKEAQFQVKVAGAKERVLQALDDEFAKDVGEYAGLDELRAKVRENLAAVREKEARTGLKQQAIDRLVAATDIQLPASMVQAEETSILRDYARRLAVRGAPEEDALRQIQAAQPEIKEAAGRNVRVSILLDGIAVAEGLKVEPAELNKALGELAERYKKPVSELRKDMIKNGALEGFHQVILEEKTLDFLLGQAVITPGGPPKGTGGE